MCEHHRLGNSHLLSHSGPEKKTAINDYKLLLVISLSLLAPFVLFLVVIIQQLMKRLRWWVARQWINPASMFISWNWTLISLLFTLSVFDFDWVKATRAVIITSDIGKFASFVVVVVARSVIVECGQTNNSYGKSICIHLNTFTESISAMQLTTAMKICH